MPEPLALFVAVAAVVGVPAGPIMALPAAVLRPESRATGMGVFYTLYYAAMAVLPAAAGFARDAAGSSAPILFAAAMMVAALGCVGGLRAARLAWGRQAS